MSAMFSSAFKLLCLDTEWVEVVTRGAKAVAGATASRFQFLLEEQDDGF